MEEELRIPVMLVCTRASALLIGIALDVQNYHPEWLPPAQLNTALANGGCPATRSERTALLEACDRAPVLTHSCLKMIGMGSAPTGGSGLECFDEAYSQSYPPACQLRMRIASTSWCCSDSVVICWIISVNNLLWEGFCKCLRFTVPTTLLCCLLDWWS